jgi:two-component system response regulator AdeR
MATHPEAGTAAVVEDDPRLAQQIEDILGLAGWKTQRFSRGRDFLARQQRAAFDVALIDMRLPDLTGMDLLEKLAASMPAADGRRTASLVVTGLMDEGHLEQAFALGAEDYVLKPFRARELIARIGAAHRRRRSAATMTGVDLQDAVPHTVGCFRISQNSARSHVMENRLHSPTKSLMRQYSSFRGQDRPSAARNSASESGRPPCRSRPARSTPMSRGFVASCN